MRVLVTGSSGFVGGGIAARLLRAGNDVVGLARTPAPAGGAYGSIAADIGSEDAADRIAAEAERCDGIVHAAASLHFGAESPAVLMTNCLGTQQMLTLAQRWGSAHFVYISSIGVIGTPTELPVTEDHPTRPTTAYHASKLFGETLTGLAAAPGLAAASLRLTSPVGRGMRQDRILSVFAQRALAGEPLQVAGNGSRTQDYVDVEDVARAVELCLGKPTTGVYNIAHGHSVSNAELARACVEALRSSSKVELGNGVDSQEGQRWEVSIQHAADDLGYQPQVQLGESIRSAIEEHARSADR